MLYNFETWEQNRGGEMSQTQTFTVKQDVETVRDLASGSLLNGWYQRKGDATEEITEILFKINSEVYNTLNLEDRRRFRTSVRSAAEFLSNNYLRRKSRGGWYLSNKCRE